MVPSDINHDFSLLYIAFQMTTVSFKMLTTKVFYQVKGRFELATNIFLNKKLKGRFSKRRRAALRVLYKILNATEHFFLNKIFFLNQSTKR